MNFPLRTAFAASYKFLYVVFLFLFLSRYFSISHLISSLTYWLFSSIFFLKNLQFQVFFFINLFIYFIWLCWVFASARGPSPAVASGGHSSSRCAGLSPPRPLSLQSTSSRRTGSAVVAHGPSCSTACGILPDQGSNPCPLHQQADSQPLRHQGSPVAYFLITIFYKFSSFLLVTDYTFILSWLEKMLDMISIF